MQVRTKSVSSMLRMRSVWRNSSPASQSVETAEELIRRYQVQLDYYAQALERLTGKSVKEKLIYSFALSSKGWSFLISSVLNMSNSVCNIYVSFLLLSLPITSISHFLSYETNHKIGNKIDIFLYAFIAFKQSKYSARVICKVDIMSF